MSRRDFLVEIGTEELPPKSLRGLMDAFADGIHKGLAEHDLACTELQPYATPRRLAVLVTGLQTSQQDRTVERRGPPVKIAFDADGNPTTAARKFVEGCGVSLEELTTLKTDKGEWLLYRGTEAGKTTAELLPDIVATSLAGLPVPKPMRWGSRSEEFVRPVHWVVMLWGDEVLEGRVIGMPAGRHTQGHRFHAPERLAIASPVDYAESLRGDGHVIASFDDRRHMISGQIEEVAAEHGGVPVVDDDLLDEVAALVEWPVPLAGRFDKRYLVLPGEVLISTLKDHQRYFPVVDNHGDLLPWFVTISNIASKDPDVVRKGNERVVEPRLADAAFFFDRDRKKTLESRTARLDDVVFQKQLGSLADKSARVGELAVAIAGDIGGDAQRAAQAARLAKCDLMTEMVVEFPDLQGIMGRYYAQHDELDDEVAAAMEEQYRPRFAGDDLPDTPTGQALALADRIDTLTGIFAIGKKPSGTRDPFGLRRAALGVLRIVIERRLDLDLHALVASAAERVMPVVANMKKRPYEDAGALTDEVFDYLMDRLRGYFLDDAHGHYRIDMFEAVLATRPTRPLDFAERLAAVHAFMALDASASLSAANKRIANILRGAGDTPERFDDALLSEAAERALAGDVTRLAKQLQPAFAERRYADALTELAALHEPVDRFFDDVLVMAEDDDVRRNRLALLATLRRLFLYTADFSKIQH